MSGSAAALYDGMSPSQRYEIDTYGFCHLPSALSAPELTAALAAAAASPAETTGGGLAFASQPALEQLAAHPATLPLLLELCRGEPRLVSGGLLGSGESGDLSSSEGESGRHVYRSSEDERCRCDALAVLFFLADQEPGDPGLLVEVSSHKSQFARPVTLAEATEGLVNLCPCAGDVMILPEATSYTVLPRPNAGRAQPSVLALRFESGGAAGQLQAPRLPRELSAPTAALLRGDGDGLRALCDERGPRPELPQPRACWNQGRSPGALALAGGAGMTPEQRYLLDTHGFVSACSGLPLMSPTA